jgi:hypothetical protein
LPLEVNLIICSKIAFADIEEVPRFQFVVVEMINYV